jgi:hypothetical protein
MSKTPVSFQLAHRKLILKLARLILSKLRLLFGYKIFKALGSYHRLLGWVLG